MALVVLSVVEQRLDAVRAVLAGGEVTEVASRLGVHRATVHRWIARYLAEQIGGLVDRSHRPAGCPHQVSAEVEAAVVDMRRKHPRWGSRRIRLELLKPERSWDCPVIEVPSERTIDRIMVRSGLARQRPRKRPRDSFIRFERPGPMQLWGIDIVGGVTLVNPVTGELREAKVVTGVDDHSRFCVMAAVVERSTARAVCVAFVQALTRYGVPEEVITDNGVQFTDRFSPRREGRSPGEVLFDKICRKNGINHLLTAPASPNQNGKVERFHGTFRPEISEQGPFESLALAQEAVDEWVAHYNSERPHQALDEHKPVMPADRFAPADHKGIDVWLPTFLEVAASTSGARHPNSETQRDSDQESGPAMAVVVERVVPASGNLGLAGRQFWIGRKHAGATVRFEIETEWVHLFIGERKLKSLTCRFTETERHHLAAEGAVKAATPRPMRPVPALKRVVEVERTVSLDGRIRLGGHAFAVSMLLAGQRVGVYLDEDSPMLIFDIETRVLLRARPNPFTFEEAETFKLRRPVGRIPDTKHMTVVVHRRTGRAGTIMVARQKVLLGTSYAFQTVTVEVRERTLTLLLSDGETRVIQRANTVPVRRMKASATDRITEQF